MAKDGKRVKRNDCHVMPTAQRFLACSEGKRRIANERAGGEGGIRTHDTVSRIHAFQACALSHSATSPLWKKSTSQYSDGVSRYQIRESDPAACPGCDP